MSVVKIATGLACGLIILLLSISFTAKNPEIALYEKTVKTLMQQEHLNSIQAVEIQFPILKDIKAKMDEIADLKEVVHSKTHHLAQSTSREESIQIAFYTKQVKQLQKLVRVELLELLATYSDLQP